MAIFSLFGLIVFGAAVWMAMSAFAASPSAPSITAHPATPTNSTSASFTFTDTQSVSRFECRMDSAAFATCGTSRPTSKTFTGLSAGSHTFQVRAVVTSGPNTGTSSATSYSWVIDRTAPTVSSITRTDASPTRAGSVRWTVAFSEPVTGVATNDFSLSSSGLSGSQSVTGVSGSGSSYTVTASTGSGTPPGSGTLQLRVPNSASVTDLAGNGLSGLPVNGPAYTIDKTAPRVVSMNRAGASPTRAASVSWTVVFSEPVTGVAKANFRLGSMGVFGTPVVTGVSGIGSTYTVTASTGTTTPFGLGELQLQLTSSGAIADLVGNGLAGVPDYGQIYVLVKNAPHAPLITSNPANPSASTSATFRFTDSSTGVTLYCSLDSGAFTVCSSPKSYSGLTQGAHSFHVKAVDTFGNSSPTTSYSWVVDSAAPAVTFTQTPPNPDSNTSTTFKWTGSDGSGSGVNHYLCKLDSGAYAPCTTPHTLSGLSAAAHTFRVEAVDNAGNISAPASYTWTISTSSAGVSYSISGTVSTSSVLYPGAAPTPLDLSFTSTNAGNGGSGATGVQVSHLTVAILSVTGGTNVPNTCTASDFALTQFSGTYPFYVPQGTHDLLSLGFTSAQLPAIQMLDRTTVNQDGCGGATVNLTYTGSP